MKITVKGEGHRILIPVPDWLLFSRLTVKLFLWSLRKSDAMPEGLNEQHVEHLFSEAQRMVKKYGHWELLHAQTANGDQISITM